MIDTYIDERKHKDFGSSKNNLLCDLIAAIFIILLISPIIIWGKLSLDNNKFNSNAWKTYQFNGEYPKCFKMAYKLIHYDELNFKNKKFILELLGYPAVDCGSYYTYNLGRKCFPKYKSYKFNEYLFEIGFDKNDIVSYYFIIPKDK
jgi:hypothetical protein